MKRFFISTRMNFPLIKIKKLLGIQCHSVFVTNFKGENYFLISIEKASLEIIQQKIISNISDPSLSIIEFNNSFDYQGLELYVDPSLPQIEDLVNSFFVGGWIIEKGNNNLYYKICASQKDDIMNLACFLKYQGITFGSSLEQLPIVEIQNLPLGFGTLNFNQLNDQFFHISIVYSIFSNNEQSCTGFILTKTFQESNELIKKMNMATIAHNQIIAFHKFSSSSISSSLSNDSMMNSESFSSQNSFNQNKIFFNNQKNYGNQYFSQIYPQLPSSSTFNNNNNSQIPTNQQKRQKDIFIYPSSFVRTVIIKQSPFVVVEELKPLVEKFGIVEKLSIIESNDDFTLFKVIYNKIGSCDTILRSNLFKNCAKMADICVSPLSISPVFQFFPEPQQNENSNLSLFDIKMNTVIVALEKDDDLNAFFAKMENYGIVNRLVYQFFEDRMEVAVTFVQPGSSKTLLNCKEYSSSSVMADELFKYRSSQQYLMQQNLYIQKRQQQQQQQTSFQPNPLQQQQQMSFQTNLQQQKVNFQLNPQNQQQPMIFQPYLQQQPMNMHQNPQQPINFPMQNHQFHMSSSLQQQNFGEISSQLVNQQSSGASSNAFMFASGQNIQRQCLIVSPPQNPYN